MSQKNGKSNVDKNAAKKAAVLGKEKKRSFFPVLVMFVCAGLVIGGSFFFLGSKGEAPSPAAKPSAPVPAAATQEFRYATSLFEDGKARFYDYQTGDGLTIKYFVLKSSDGVIRAAFDACDSCWSAGKGYYQQGDNMVCRNCRRRFASVKVNEVKGGCNPAPLTRTVAGENVVIRVNDILEGRQYFDFAKQGSS
jgi:uncharacterized membrane protein